MCFRVAPRMDIKKHVSQRNWIIGSEYIYNSKLNSRHNWGNLEVHLISTRILTLIINKTHLPVMYLMKFVARYQHDAHLYMIHFEVTSTMIKIRIE